MWQRRRRAHARWVIQPLVLFDSLKLEAALDSMEHSLEPLGGCPPGCFLRCTPHVRLGLMASQIDIREGKPGVIGVWRGGGGGHFDRGVH